MNIYEYCFTSLSAQSWQYRDRRKLEAETMPYFYFEWIQGFFIVHSTKYSTVHCIPLNSLEHCICTTTMTNIRPDRDSNLVPPGYKPQSIHILGSHRMMLLIWRDDCRLEILIRIAIRLVSYIKQASWPCDCGQKIILWINRPSISKRLWLRPLSELTQTKYGQHHCLGWGQLAWFVSFLHCFSQWPVNVEEMWNGGTVMLCLWWWTAQRCDVLISI